MGGLDAYKALALCAKRVSELSLLSALAGRLQPVLKHAGIANELTLDASHAYHVLSNNYGFSWMRGKLWLYLGNYELRCGRYLRAKVALEEALTSARAASDEEELELTAMGNLAAVQRELGELEVSRALQEEVLSRFRQALGEENPATLRARSNLATTLTELGELKGARDHQEKGLAVAQSTLGAEHGITIALRHNLVFTLAKLEGQGADMTTLEHLLANSRRAYGEDHPDTLTVMNSLADTLAERGQLTEARSLHEDVLRCRRQQLGPEHPDTLGSMHSLAQVIFEQGKTSDDAQALLEQTFEALQRVLGINHSRTLLTLKSLARCLAGRGDLAAATTLLVRWLTDLRKKLGDFDPIISDIAWELLSLQGGLGSGAAKILLADVLFPLVEKSPADLSANQREIRRRLRLGFDASED